MARPGPDKTTTDKAKRDPQRTKARILAAATTEFTRNGLGGARVDQRADRRQREQEARQVGGAHSVEVVGRVDACGTVYEPNPLWT